MKRHVLAWAVAAIVASAAHAAPKKCQLSQFVQFPITMAGAEPIIAAKFGEKDVRFILDSGAFYSTLSNAAALEHGLKLKPAPDWFRLRGLNGDVSVSFTEVQNFGIAGVTVPKVGFIVGGTDTGRVGLLGQNFLGIGDVEYDLPHGEVRLIKSQDCEPGALAYWAGNRPVTIVQLQPRNAPFQVHTIGTVTLNAVKLRAMFDTGAGSSMITRAAARRLGITPASPGVEPAMESIGLGTKSVRTWLATFDTLDIGGELIPHPKIRVGEFELGDSDMLIGIDFFLTHRVYVANKAAKMLITYEGGPMFGLTPRGVRSSDGKALEIKDTRADPTDAEGFSRRGAVYASNGKTETAIADLDRAVALAPKDARYLRQRATIRLGADQPKLAEADLDKAIALDPAEPEAHMMRAAIHLRAKEQAGVAEDLRAADKTLPTSSDRRMALGGMFEAIDDYEAYLANTEAWLKSHPEDAGRPVALNSRCWARALLNRQLADALADCNAALRLRPGTPSFLDSRALVRLRRGEWKLALADYDAALKGMPGSAWSLYGRSLTKTKLGDSAGADTDRAAALKIDATVAERGKKIGLES